MGKSFTCYAIRAHGSGISFIIIVDRIKKNVPSGLLPPTRLDKQENNKTLAADAIAGGEGNG